MEQSQTLWIIKMKKTTRFSCILSLLCHFKVQGGCDEILSEIFNPRIYSVYECLYIIHMVV